MKPTNAQIRQFIISYFNDLELETFCFDFFPEVKQEFTRGMEFSHKAELLIGYCQRRRLETNLLTNLQQERPSAFEPHFATTIEAPPVAPAKLRNPRQVFISYAHEDAELAERLTADLEAEGYPVWMAPDSIQPGEKWAAAISRGLDESGIFVLLLTPAAVKSRWVLSETDVAIELEHEDAMRVFMLQVEACKIPALWRVYQRIPFRRGYDAGLAGLLAAIDGQQPPGGSKPPGGLALRPARSTTNENSFIHEKTGLEFVRIPAGEFLYGSNKERIELPEFWISKTPVTNQDYVRYKIPERWINEKKFSLGRHPFVNISWNDAIAYCEWARLRLPTEEEWEKAARGTDGRDYPWGNENPTGELCNFGNNGVGTTPVGKYSPLGDSPYGCVDMSGNVWEWTSSLYKEGSDKRIVRGGSWTFASSFARVTARFSFYPDIHNHDIGFRVVPCPPFYRGS